MHARECVHTTHPYKNMVNTNGLHSAYEIFSINTGQSSKPLAADGKSDVDEPSHNNIIKIKNIQTSFENRSIYSYARHV